MCRAACWLIVLVLFLPRLHGGEVVFATYNVQNYLPMSRQVDGKRVAKAGKPDSEIAAVVNVIKKIRPDILGLVEMGDKSTLRDLQQRLKAAGIDLPHSEWHRGFDQERHVCLLSRYPITARNSRGDIPFPLNGRIERMNRGILDVTVEVSPAFTLRLVGAHLKSRRPVPEYDETAMRAREAWFLRDHVAGILKAEPKTNLLLFGDFNDTKNEYPIRTLIGRRGTSTHMTDLPLTDSRGELWTHYWKTADSYARIDFIMVNRALAPRILLKKSGVNDSPFWLKGSDHRALFVTISSKSSS